MSECNCGPELTQVLLMALGLLVGLLLATGIAASVSASALRIVRFLRSNTVRLFVSTPREQREQRAHGGSWGVVWALALLAVLVGVILTSLITIGNAS